MQASSRLSSFIFRTRGLYIFLAIVASMFLKYRLHGTTSLALILAGLAISLLSQAFRTYSAAFLWGRQAVLTPEADFLCTSGPYAYVRNPLYLGNLAISLGISIALNAWYAYVLVSASWALVYSIVIPYEERFLSGKFSDLYADYMSRTGRLIPRPSPYRSKSKIAPDFRAAIVGEIHALAVLIVLYAVISALFLR